jgi:plastocyanin
VLSACGASDSITPSNGGDLGSVLVTVSDDQNRGVPGIALSLARDGQNPRSGTTGSDGTHAFTGVTAGSWTLAAVLDGGFTLAQGELDQRPVAVPANGVATPRIHVVAEGTSVIAGQMLHGGAGVAGVQVKVRGGGGRELGSTTAFDGRFSVGGLAAGGWAIEITPPAYFVLAAGESGTRTVTVAARDTATVNVGLVRPGGPTTQLVSLLMDSYDPGTITVPPGTRIRWVNVYDKAHTISPGGHWAWRVVEMNKAGEQFEAVLNNPGIYTYLCEYLYANGMLGTIRVEP